MRHSFYTIFLFFIFQFSSFSQTEQGLPYIRNYSAAEYGAGTDNWAVTQDKRGVMYFGNFSGVLEYDGARWRTIPVSNQSLVRSLAVDSAGVVFVGAVGDFGYLAPQKNGELTYHSLLGKVPEEARDFGDVWKTWATPDGIYFQSYDFLFLFRNQQIKIIRPVNSFHFSFYVSKKLFITDRGRGLMQIINDSLIPSPQGNFFADKRIYALLPLEGDTLLVATREEGLFRMNLNGSEKENNVISPFNCEANAFLLKNQTYHGIILNKDTYVFATRLGGAVVVNKHGNIIRILNKKNLLQNENVRYVFSDAEGGLWLALDDGIARAEINSPVNIYPESSGFKGAVSDGVKFNGSLFITTTQGIFKFDKSAPGKNSAESFSPVKNINAQSWDLLVVKNENNPHEILLAATTDGVYEIKQNSAALISKSYGYKLYPSKKNPARVYIGTNSGLSSVKFENNRWIEEGKMEGINSEIRSISEDTSGDIFVGMPFLGVARFHFCDACPGQADTVYSTYWNEKYVIDKFDTSSGLPNLVWNTVFESSGGIFVGTFNGLFSFEYNSKKFVPENRFGQQFADGSRQVYGFVQDKTDTWIYTANNKGRELFCFHNDLIICKPFRRVYEHEIHSVYPEDSSNLWLGSANGLIHYDLKNEKNFDFPFYSLIRKVVAGKDSVIFWGSFFPIIPGADSSLIIPSSTQPEDLIFSLPFHLNSIAFEFSASYFDSEVSNKFRWFLEGYDKEWSEWSKESKTHYTNLREGKYIFHLQSQNIYETPGKEALYEFKILPPWYRTIAAYIFYFLLLLSVIYGSVKISVRRLELAKIKLENIVKERTAEVVKQKEKIESQNHQLENKNKEITDSINYARRIQEAILPGEEYLKEVFNPEEHFQLSGGGSSSYFVLFKPKDIVSGDFFWTYQTPDNKLIWAAVDCTGHGVPGAFMSMIGNSLLNEIVVENKVRNSDEILNNLREAIIKSLKQTGEAGKQKDGMDIALCVLDKNKNSLQFSGANNPFWLIRNGELTSYKPDKQPIGYYSEQMKPFTRQEIQLQEGDALYTFTDGYEDQFGGPKQKKFMAKQLRELLLSIQNKTMEEQKEILNLTIIDWMGDQEQIDDICVIGVKITVTKKQ